MSQPEDFKSDVARAIRDHAMTLPRAEEGTSCVNRAFKAGGKNFAFLGETEELFKLRLKLKDSIDEVNERFDLGSSGWTMLAFPPDDAPPLEDLGRWIEESFRLLAPKKIVAELND